MNLLIKDKDGNPSLTETVFLYGCLVCIAKLAFSGFDVGTFLKVPTFGGSDFGMAIASLGGIYSLQSHVGNLAKKDKEG
jgi:hypothetical protein